MLKGNGTGQQEDTEQRTIAELKKQQAEDLAKQLQNFLGESERQLYFSQIYRAIGEIEAG